jgi:hypothetical protein
MVSEDRIKAFEKLGNYLSAIDRDELLMLSERARNENPWFTTDSVSLALSGTINYLNGNSLREWTSRYNLTGVNPKIVSIIMAGNVPLVGFHDFLSVLISGHSALIKLSSKDSLLLKFLTDKLVMIAPSFNDRIAFAEQLKNFDAVIATGSDNSARYFNYYFGKYPNIIRKNRTSVAVLTSRETNEELTLLGKDIFSYFGLGCRNVSKLFVPKQYDITQLFQHWNVYKDVIHHHKYCNNYDYQKSILLINREHFFDSEFVMLQESEKLVSPISVVYFERYADESDLALKLTSVRERIQCIVGSNRPATVQFGQAQTPLLWDYADRVDTLKFLEQLN